MRQEIRRSIFLGAAAVAAVIAAVAGSLSSFAAAKPRQGGSLPPLAWTTHVDAFSATEVVVYGRFNPRGHRTIVWFEYGPTRSYGHVAPEVAEEDWYGESLDQEEEILECLRPRTVYHYRVVARNKFGTVHGRDRAFRTPARHSSRQHEYCDGRV